MAKTFHTAAAFRTSLEQRLNQIAVARGTALNALRLKLVIERLLARLFADPEPPWVLKGGFAMDLRHRPRARTTKDIDLGVSSPRSADTVQLRLDTIREQLQTTADRDLGDFLGFRISAPRSQLQGAPLGGGRFPVEAVLAGKVYARLHIDIGFGDPLTDVPEQLTGDTLLDFIGVPPVKVLAVPRAQQFAEKVHAYTFPWTDRINTRSKDLVDFILLIDSGLPPADTIRRTVRTIFTARGTHPVPTQLPLPPPSWRAEFASLAEEAQLALRDMDAVFSQIARFWDDNALGG